MAISLQKDKQCRWFEVKTESGKPVDRNYGKETKKLLRIKSQRGNVKVTRLDDTILCWCPEWVKLNFWLRTLCAGHPGFRRFRDSVLATVFLQHWHVKINLLTCARGWLVKILGQLNLSVTDPHYCFEKDVLIIILNLVNCLIFCSGRAVLVCKKMMRK